MRLLSIVLHLFHIYKKSYSFYIHKVICKNCTLTCVRKLAIDPYLPIYRTDQKLDVWINWMFEGLILPTLTVVIRGASVNA